MPAVTSLTARDPKWNQPGWRIERHYDPCVMIGNWSEERMKFGRGAIPQHDSTYGTDYRAYNKLVGPNVTNRRRALIREDGLPHEQIIKHHHGYRNHLITWYDEHYNRRERPACQRFPLLRDYSSNKLAWIPEKTDHPLEGPPTNYGLLPKLQSKWRDQFTQFESTYRVSYTPCPSNYYADLRMATPRAHSSTLNPVNRILKSVAFRGESRCEAPEYLGPPPNPSIIAHSFDAPPGLNQATAVM